MSPNRIQNSVKVYAHLLSLPGEIRNQVYDLCLQHSVDSLKIRVPRHASEKGELQAFVLPRWHGHGRLTMGGIGAIPLLFACKKAYDELSGLIMSKVARLVIGGYILQSPSEDPNVRWQIIYSIMANQPTLRNFVKKVKIRLPSMREDLHKGYWRSIGYSCPTVPRNGIQWAVVPSLVEFLRTCKSLSHLEMEIVVDSKDVPDFCVLLPIYDIFREKTVVSFDPIIRGRNIRLTEDWENAWHEFLRQNRMTSSEGHQ